MSGTKIPHDDTASDPTCFILILMHQDYLALKTQNPIRPNQSIFNKVKGQPFFTVSLL
jgi:hypothetical protein